MQEAEQKFSFAQIAWFEPNPFWGKVGVNTKVGCGGGRVKRTQTITASCYYYNL